jgi:hypothetical protein
MIYVFYAIFMKYNMEAERFIKIRVLGMDESIFDSELCESITVRV